MQVVSLSSWYTCPIWLQQQPSGYVTKRAQRSEDSILLWRGWADAFSSDNVVEQHSLTHFPSHPLELDVGEWECVIEMQQEEYAENCRNSIAERQVSDSNRHPAFSKQRKCRETLTGSLQRSPDRIQRRGDVRVQGKTRASRIRRVIAAGRSTHDIANQVTMIRENRQDRRTPANQPSRNSREVMLEEARIEPRNRKLPQSKAILMKTEMKRTARVRRQREEHWWHVESEQSNAKCRH